MSSAVRAARSVCVFAGSRSGRRPAYVRAARELVAAMHERGLDLVYGGGNVGLMNELAEAALGRGLKVVGVIPENLRVKEAAHLGVSELRIVDSMLTRKALMAELSAAFVAIPGGLGTYDELFEMLTWGQLHLHDKPCGVLNVEGYFDPLIAVVARAVEEGFLRADQAERMFVEERAPALLDRMLASPRPAAVPR